MQSLCVGPDIRGRRSTASTPRLNRQIRRPSGVMSSRRRRSGRIRLRSCRESAQEKCRYSAPRGTPLMERRSHQEQGPVTSLHTVHPDQRKTCPLMPPMVWAAVMRKRREATEFRPTMGVRTRVEPLASRVTSGSNHMNHRQPIPPSGGVLRRPWARRLGQAAQSGPDKASNPRGSLEPLARNA
jgi:hypothetical protein